MSIDLNRLKTMKKEELIQVAKQTNTPYHHLNSVDTLVKNIINKVSEKIVTHPQPSLPVDVNTPAFLTEAEIEKSLMGLKERQKAFSTIYNFEDQCVTLKYYDGRYSHAETMSLSCPLTKIVRKAQEIAKGPLILRGHRPEDWEQLSRSTGKNAYTQTVL